MSATYEQAIDEIFARFHAIWTAQTPAVTLEAPELRWQGIENPEHPGYDKYWVRVSQQTIDEGQASLRAPECGQRYRTNGLLFIQIFCPKSDARAMEKGRQLAVIARDCFRGYTTQSGVWFRNSRVSELEPEERWLRLNVIVAYQYDETT
jgi:hypothetical protein